MGIKRSVAALGALLAAALLLSVGCGSQWYTPARLWQALCAADAADPVWRILCFVRLPRTAAAVIRDAVYYILMEERGDPA